MSKPRDIYYAEAQVNRWLAWLASNMRRHDQTVFLIENLQPGWLQTSGERRTFTGLTRLLWGIWAGLTTALLIGLAIGLDQEQNIGLMGALMDGLSFGLLAGIVIGLLAGLIDARKLRSSAAPGAAARPPGSRKFVTSLLGVALAVGVLIGLLGPILGVLIEQPDSRLLAGLLDMLSGGPIIGLFFGLLFALIFTSRSTFRSASTAIRPVETLNWSRAAALRVGRRGLVVGLLFGLIFGLIAGLIADLEGGMVDLVVTVLVIGLLFALIFTLLFGLIGGLTPVMQELKTAPNQGIRLSVQNALRIGGIGGLLGGLGMGSLSLLLLGSVGQAIGAGIVYGLIVAVVVGGWFGGIDALEHGILRLIISRKGYAPLDYARFLDYAAAELNFLQKVGGGYLFVHRYLLEYFAAMVDAPAQDAATDPVTHRQGKQAMSAEKL
ncbi:MAG: hypothetical protein IAE92_15655 [Burkholderiaceae bacterium]|nr:hypothetical protein [Burkholderiaceae bacterium]